MDILVLRLIHVASGAFWVGAVFSFFLFVSPTARALGPEGQRFVAHLISRQRFSNAILVPASSPSRPGFSCCGGPPMDSTWT